MSRRKGDDEGLARPQDRFSAKTSKTAYLTALGDDLIF